VRRRRRTTTRRTRLNNQNIDVAASSPMPSDEVILQLRVSISALHAFIMKSPTHSYLYHSFSEESILTLVARSLSPSSQLLASPDEDL